MPIIDVHTHCSPRVTGDPFGVAEVMRGTPVGKNSVTNFRGLPAVSYHDMYDFDLQEQVCAAAGVTGRIISTPFAAEAIAWASKKPAIYIVKSVNYQIAAIVAQEAFWDLDAPIERIGAAPAPPPYAPELERAWLPDRADIARALRCLAAA